jgi:hypothetical protein
MARQVINIGTSANDGTGDKIRNAFSKSNSNFTELYDEKLTSVVAGTNVTIDNTDPLNPIINASGGGGGSQTLNQVLIEGNITDGEDIFISNGDKILLDNGANLKKGTTDAGLGGSKGIALRCAVDYELKWEAGRLYVMQGDGFTIREVSHNFTTTPTVTDDATKGFVVGSRWILDNGDLYVCTDDATDDAIWEFVLPTLEQILDNNHDLINRQNFQGTNAGLDSTGIFVNIFGESAGTNNTADEANFFGQSSGYNNTGANPNFLGALSGVNNSGANVNAFGNGAGINNTYKNVNLFGVNATADAENQTVFTKWISGATTYWARLSFNNITDNRKYELPDASGTLALTSDIPSATPDATTTVKGIVKLAGDLDGTAALPTIAANAVTNAKLATIATKTFKGRTSSGTGNVEDLSVSTVRTDLSINNVDNTSDINKPVSTATQTAINTATTLGSNANGQLSLASGNVNFDYSDLSGGDGIVTNFHVKHDSTDFVDLSNNEYVGFDIISKHSLTLKNDEFNVEVGNPTTPSLGAIIVSPSLVRLSNSYFTGATGAFRATDAGNISIGGGGAAPIITLSGEVNISKDKLLIKGTSTGKTNLTTANASATDYTVTLPATTGTVALTSQLASTMTNVAGGLVPTPPNNTTTFLRGDGTFAAPAGGGGSSQVKLAAQTLSSGSWTLVGNFYEYTFTNANIVSTGFVTFTPNNASINEVSTCRMLPQIDAATGTCKFYSLFPPQTNIVGEIVIFIL